MKKQWMLPALALVSGAAAFALRLWQNATGFEEETGLAVPGVFAAGDCTGKPLQLAKAVGEGNVAALSACEYIDSMNK